MLKVVDVCIRGFPGVPFHRICEDFMKFVPLITIKRLGSPGVNGCATIMLGFNDVIVGTGFGAGGGGGGGEVAPEPPQAASEQHATTQSKMSAIGDDKNVNR